MYEGSQEQATLQPHAARGYTYRGMMLLFAVTVVVRGARAPPAELDAQRVQNLSGIQQVPHKFEVGGKHLTVTNLGPGIFFWLFGCYRHVAPPAQP